MMTPRELIAEAWSITIKHKRVLLPWGAMDAFVLMIGAIAFVSYQAYVLSVFFDTGDVPSWRIVFGSVFGALEGQGVLLIFLSILVIVYLILWIVIPRFATAALIGLAAKIHCGDEPKGGLVLGFFNFFPLLELAAALGLIDGKTFFSFWSLAVRYLGGDETIYTMSFFLILLWCVSFLFQFLFTFAEEAIVIRKSGVFRSLGQSFKLVISYLSKVILIGILLLIIMLRIIVNVVVIFLIPLIVMGLGLLLARFLPGVVSFGISGGIGIIAVGFASYFLGYVTVFKHTVWTITYLELSKERELDVIVTEEQSDAPKQEETQEEEKSDTNGAESG